MNQSWQTPLSNDEGTEGDCKAIRSSLLDIGYNPQNLMTDLGLGSIPELYPLDYRLLPALLDRLDKADNPRATACRLLLLGLPVEASTLKRTLSDRSVEFLIDSGLVVQQNDMLHALLSIVPFEDLLIVADKLFMNVDPDYQAEGLSSDNAVWRLDRTTQIMAKAMSRKPRERALELGCGSGVLSLLAARASQHATGVDINPRAANVAMFNARLNCISNCQFIHGDLYQPLEDQRYDYIFTNPPSAPGLVRAWNREGGGSGREVVEACIAGARPRLDDGGLFMTSLHLGYRTDQDIHEWSARQFPRDEYRTVIVRHSEHWGAEEYALNEALRKCGPRDLETYQRTYRMYRAGMAAHGIGTVCFAVLAARRGAAPDCEVVTADLYGTGWERSIKELRI